ncbi:hypothetical protein FH972_025492 [Carpinus fangiana]|uniref:F-box domain-containing protein n=1 Tax=Carpinus fangiana TaxID=176857 RepID=A0A5N6L1K4_9ROSI|nr:hypothetical protein FH972_025492 [Carpinus fangiana]
MASGLDAEQLELDVLEEDEDSGEEQTDVPESGRRNGSRDELAGLSGPQQTELPAPSQQTTMALHKTKAKCESLELLDLPADILEIIIKDITHTNDLCALSLTCSALHAFAVPHIYSRFDIVWPDSTAQLDPKSGVDALTYGLSTLVMAEELFGEAPSQQPQPVQCEACGHLNLPIASSPTRSRPPDSQFPLASITRRRRRYGNHYAQYCRKFSLGNGPKEWVKDYMVSNEAGKLLGTQVALAVARMRNLESFVWDMPTGILQEVWKALASLDHRGDGKECKLERIWIRWHNNSHLLQSEEPEANHATENNPPGPHTAGNAHAPQAVATGMSPTVTTTNFCESPTFSILPPVKSLSVVDIDVVDYLDEMAILISRSRHCLRELRVGIASYVDPSEWSNPALIQVYANATGERTPRPRRMGGILGSLFAHIFRVTPNGILRGTAMQSVGPTTAWTAFAAAHAKINGPPDTKTSQSGANNTTTSTTLSRHTTPRFVEHLPVPDKVTLAMSTSTDTLRTPQNTSAHKLPVRSGVSSTKTHDDGDRLPLEILELERVPLSVFTVREALDWSKLAEITLLDCAKHEQFWRSLRRQFSRSTMRNASWQTTPSKSFGSAPFKAPEIPSYTLHLRKIHVNAVSPSLIAFMRDALGPNTIETLFLHASAATESQYNAGGARQVSLDQIYRGPLRRHARSLIRLSIDSGLRISPNALRGGMAASRKTWTLTRDVLGFITSGRLRSLRELSVCLDHRDWHFFLQRLPAVYHLRSLYIPQILDRASGRPMEALTGIGSLSGAREFAQQILDIVILRPEVGLCYLGMFDKCFEILEGRQGGNTGKDGWDGPRRQITSDGQDGFTTTDTCKTALLGEPCIVGARRIQRNEETCNPCVWKDVHARLFHGRIAIARVGSGVGLRRIELGRVHDGRGWDLQIAMAEKPDLALATSQISRGGRRVRALSLARVDLQPGSELHLQAAQQLARELLAAVAAAAAAAAGLKWAVSSIKQARGYGITSHLERAHAASGPPTRTHDYFPRQNVQPQGRPSATAPSGSQRARSGCHRDRRSFAIPDYGHAASPPPLLRALTARPAAFPVPPIVSTSYCMSINIAAAASRRHNQQLSSSTDETLRPHCMTAASAIDCSESIQDHSPASSCPQSGPLPSPPRQQCPSRRSAHTRKTKKGRLIVLHTPTHITNQPLRAYIAASRRSDRSLEARVESARRASEIHKKRTGRSLRVTEQDVVNEEMYEEEDDDLPLQYRRLTAHLHTNSSDFNRRLSAYLTSHQAMRNALGQALANSYAQSAGQDQQGSHTQPWNQLPGQFTLNMPSMSSQNAVSPSAMQHQSPSGFRQTPYPMNHNQTFAHHRSASIATPNPTSDSTKEDFIKQEQPDLRRLSAPIATNAFPMSLPSSSKPTSKDVDCSNVKQTSGNTVFPQPAGNPIWDQNNDLGPFATDLPHDARMFLDDQSLSRPYLAPGSFDKHTSQPSYDGMNQTLAPGALDTKFGDEFSWNGDLSAISDSNFDTPFKHTSTTTEQDTNTIYSATTPGEDMWNFIDDNAYEATT